MHLDDEDEEEEEGARELSDLWEYILIYSGFTGAASLTAIVFVVTFARQFSEVSGSALTEILAFTGISLLTSIFAGLSILLSWLEKQHGEELEYLNLFSLICTAISSISLVLIVPLFVAPFSLTLTVILDACLFVLIGSFFAVLVWNRL